MKEADNRCEARGWYSPAGCELHDGPATPQEGTSARSGLALTSESVVAGNAHVLVPQGPGLLPLLPNACSVIQQLHQLLGLLAD